MALIRIFTLLLILFINLVSTNELIASSKSLAIQNKQYTPYVRPDYISEEVWQSMEPYFLPINHSLKAKLDRIFNKGRVISNTNEMLAAGFYKIKVGKYSHAVIARHPSLKNYLVKLMTDDSPHTDWKQLKKRVSGSVSARETIKVLGYENFFKVPHKWIYPLPSNSKPKAEVSVPKGFILIAEDMDILTRSKNYSAWKKKATPELLDALFHVLQTEGLSDSSVAFNIPFSHDGRIALIDLEHNHSWPVPFHRLLQFLRPEMQLYWQSITQNN